MSDTNPEVAPLECREPVGQLVTAAATLRGRRIVLRPVVPVDYGFLFQLSQHENICFRWRLRNTTPSYESFVAALFQGVLAQFMITRADDGEPVGLITAYNADFKNGIVYLALLVRPDEIRGRTAFDSLILFLNYLFESWPFRKVYFETTDLSFGNFASGSKRLFRLEGHLEGHEYYAGRYWDMYIGAFVRGEWEHTLRVHLPKIAAETTVPIAVTHATASLPGAKDR